MNVIGAVTASAAGIAAILAGINLYVSGRREQKKWIREALVETLVTFLDSSFKHGVAYRILSSGRSLQDLERRHLHATVVEAHDQQGEALTRLQLLGPPQLVEAADALHDREHAMAAACFGEPASAVEVAEAVEDARISIQRAREQVLKAARRAIRLGDIAGISDVHDADWEEFRYRTQVSRGSQEV